MKLVDVADCAESCSWATRKAFEMVLEEGRLGTTVLGRREKAYQVVFSLLASQEQNVRWVVIRRTGNHDYQIIERRGTIPGFNERAHLELARACIRAVRFQHIRD